MMNYGGNDGQGLFDSKGRTGMTRIDNLDNEAELMR